MLINEIDTTNSYVIILDYSLGDLGVDLLKLLILKSPFRIAWSLLLWSVQFVFLIVCSVVIFSPSHLLNWTSASVVVLAIYITAFKICVFGCCFVVRFYYLYPWRHCWSFWAILCSCFAVFIAFVLSIKYLLEKKEGDKIEYYIANYGLLWKMNNSVHLRQTISTTTWIWKTLICHNKETLIYILNLDSEDAKTIQSVITYKY